MEQFNCTTISEQDRTSESRHARWRYWHCRGEKRDDDSPSDYEPNADHSTATSSCDYGTQSSTTTTAPLTDSTHLSDQSTSFSELSQASINDQVEETRSSPTVLIAGIVSGVTLVILMGAIFWWLLRRRRAQQFSMPSKESSRSVEQHQPSFKETHQVNQGQERQTGYINEISSVISRPSQTVVRHFANKSLNSISSANLPSQYPTFPSPTPRDRKPNIINGIIDLSSSPSLESSPIPQQPPLPDSILECASPMTEIALPPNDFYIDMLGIGTDDNHINYNLKAEAPNISASPSPISSPVPLPPPMSPRSRSSSIASLRKCSEIARLAGNSPKLSRDARQMVQQFPPPPPPPQVPPPAIPDDIESLLSYSRFNRSRAGTASSESKMPLNQYWESSTPSGSRPSSYASNSSRRDAPPTKSRRPASRSASLSRKVTDPNQRPLSVSQPLPEQLSQLQDGRRPLQSHRRSQSNIYSGGSTPSMDALDRSLSMSPAQIRAPSILPRPILRHNNSYSDQSSSDSAQEVEDIISDALAITVAKRQSDRISLDVDSTQDLSPYS